MCFNVSKNKNENEKTNESRRRGQEAEIVAKAKTLKAEYESGLWDDLPQKELAERYMLLIQTKEQKMLNCVKIALIKTKKSDLIQRLLLAIETALSYEKAEQEAEEKLKEAEEVEADAEAEEVDK